MAEKTNSSDKGAIVSTASGGAAGTVAGVCGVLAGAAEGTAGAAAMTSGLAAVGSAIGGGMFAGICVVGAIPVAGAVLGYGGYRFIKKLATPKGKTS